MTLIRETTPNTSEYVYSEFTPALINLSGLSTGYIDMNDFDKYQFEARSGVSGMIMRISSSRVDGGGEADDIISDTIVDSTFHLFNVICRQRWIKFEWINETGSSVSNCSMSIKVFRGSSDKLSVFPLSVNPSNFSQAGLMQSVTIGKDNKGVYRNVSVNTAGASLTSDFGTEVARDLYDGWRIFTKFGRNPNINTGTTPEDIYNGGGEYTGFNATSNEELTISSSSGQDDGTLVSSGTATGGSSTSIIDAGATFVSDGVAVGDCLINDTVGAHGFVTSVVSETELELFRMTNGDITVDVNSSGDSYRVATTNGTGCAVLRLQSVLNEDYEEQPPVYVIMNGTSDVTTSGVDAMRCSVGFTILSGTNNKNVGEITVTQATTTANVFCVIPTTGRTTIGCSTVPKGVTYLIKRIRISLVRANGSAGSGTVSMYVREPYGSWKGNRVFELQDGGGVDFTFEGGMTLIEGDDFKFTADDVSDNGTVIETALEIYKISNNG